MPDREKVIRAIKAHIQGMQCDSCPYGDECDYTEEMPAVLGDALALLEEEPRVIPLSELLTYDAKWQFTTPPYLCTEEIDARRMWWRSWGDIYHSIRCEGTMGSNNYGTEWRCWTFHPTEEQRKAAAWDG